MDRIWKMAKKYKVALSILVFFILARVLVFSTFYAASQDKGSWENFHKQTDLWKNTLERDSFIPYCDGQPPLYTTFTTFVRLFWDDRWAIYLAQIGLTLFSLFIIYRLLRLYFSPRISTISVAILAVEPYLAFYNFLFGSENLFLPLMSLAFYYFFLFLKEGNKKSLFLSAFFIGLSSLTRSNSIILLPVLSFFLFLLFCLRNRLKLGLLPSFSWRGLLSALFIANLIYVAMLLPWLVRHHRIYGQYALATIFSTNVYYYNVPALLALRNGTSFDAEKELLQARAEERLGRSIHTYADCREFSSEEFRELLAFCKEEGSRYIRKDILLYAWLHSFKSLPFFLDSGYFAMWDAYTGDSAKPDMTSALLRGDIAGIWSFLKTGGLKVTVYLGGMSVWGLASLSILGSLIYSFFRQGEKLVFFYFAALIAAYSAFVVSPFVLARYRLQINFIFIVSLVYLGAILYNRFRTKDKKL
jgi:4-amino-4-deoxy-L-arabinose transferase-like glycosyltransferase